MRIFVIGHLGGKNTGDELMLLGLLTLIKNTNNVDIIVKNEKMYSWLPSYYNIIEEPKYQKRVSLLNSKYDKLIFSGGTHFHDDYRYIRLIRHYIYLIMNLMIFRKAKKENVKVLILGNGFSPVHYRLTKFLIKILNNYSDTITVRDKNSSKNLKKLKIPHLIHSDLAFFNSQIKNENKLKTILGISLTNQKNYQRYLDDEIYLSRLISIIKTIYRKIDVELVRIVVLRGGIREDDILISKKLFNKLNVLNYNTELYDYNPNPMVTLSKIQDCTYFIGARYHSIILSLLGKVENIGILPYHQKLNDLADDLGIENCIIDIYKDNFRISDKEIEKLRIDNNIYSNLQYRIQKEKEILQELINEL